MATLTEVIANGHTKLTLEQMYKGCEKNITVLFKNLCDSCEQLNERNVTCGACGKRNIDVTFPKGTDSGVNIIRTSQFIISVTVVQEDHQHFTRNKENLFVYIQISLAESLCGFKKPIPTLDNDYIVIKPANGKVVADEEILVVRNKGMPIPNTQNEFGHLYVKFYVPLPKTMAKKLAKTLNQLLPKSDPPHIPNGVIPEEVVLHEYE